jgi:hypothetical protein
MDKVNKLEGFSMASSSSLSSGDGFVFLSAFPGNVTFLSFFLPAGLKGGSFLLSSSRFKD